MTLPATRVGRALVLLAALTAAPLWGQVTESPRTVAPGKLLVEMDGLRISTNRVDGDGFKYSALAVASTLVSAGLAEGVDVQAGVDVFLRETVKYRGARDSHSGLGDLSFRMKWTFWRNDKLGAALAVIPYVKAPSGTSNVGTDSVEGGVIIPWEGVMPGGLKTGAMFQWDVVRNDAKNGYDAHWHATGFVQRSLTRALEIYGEATLVATSTGFSDSAGTLGVGALFRVARRVQLDYELQRGLNRRASDWTNVLRVNWEW